MPSPVSLEPFSLRIIRRGASRPKGVGGRQDDDVDAAFRRPSAAPPRPDPPRALDPRLSVDQGPSRGGRPKRFSASGQPARGWPEVRHRYGLDRPIVEQYWDYLKTDRFGDLGQSIASRRSVTERDQAAVPGDAAARDRRDDLRARRRPAPRLPGRQVVRLGPFDHLSLVGSLIRDLDPDLLPSCDSEIHPSRSSSAGSRASARSPRAHRRR